MLYHFKSKVTGDLIMLEPNGRRILEIMGKVPDTNGIIQPFQMPGAIAALEAAIREDAVQASLNQGDLDAGAVRDAVAEQAVREEMVTLRQRARPMMEMLQRCHQSQADIVWGV